MFFIAIANPKLRRCLKETYILKRIEPFLEQVSHYRLFSAIELGSMLSMRFYPNLTVMLSEDVQFNENLYNLYPNGVGLLSDERFFVVTNSIQTL